MGRICYRYLFGFVILAGLLGPHYCLANDNEVIYFFGDKKTVLLKQKDKFITASKECFPLNHELCQAMEALKSVRKHSVEKFRLQGGASAGSILCTKNLKGEIVRGKNVLGGYNSFCQFKDKSLIDIGTLSYYYHLK